LRQRYTIALERIDVLRVTLEVTADNVAQAHRDAVAAAKANPALWKLDQGAPLLRKLTAHAGEVTDGD
jgi:hypothetical protein